MTDITEHTADEKLILLYKHGNQDAFSKLLQSYTPMIHFYCNKYFAKGLLQMDLFQEGCIGLYVAVTKFDAYKGAFRGFAQIHIKNFIINAVKAATRKKQQILNDYIPYYSEMEDMDGNRGRFVDLFTSDMPTPEESYIDKEESSEKRGQLIRFMRTMTRMERLVFIEIYNGRSYREASEKIGVSPKSIDNAIRRIKKKALQKVS